MFERARSWLQKHRKAVTITATVLAIAGGVVYLVVNGKKVEIPITEAAKKIIPEMNTTKADELVTVEVDGVVSVFKRSAFVRNLHEGWKASPGKIEQAKQLGIELAQGETYVNSCIVTMKSA